MTLMEINNSNVSGSYESAHFQISHRLTPPKSCCYRSSVPDSHVALPPSPLFRTDSSECFFFYSSNISSSRLQAAVVHRNKQFPGRASAGLPCLPTAECARAAHATTHTHKINAGTSRVKLGTREASLRSQFTSVKPPVSLRPCSCVLSSSQCCARTPGSPSAELRAFWRWLCIAWTTHVAC